MADKLTILVTGGAGYLGSTLVPMLLHKGHRVTVLENFMFGQASLAAACADKNFDMVRGDAREKDVVAPLAKDADLIIPLAALVGAPMCKADPVGATSINRDAVDMLCGLLSKEQMVIMPVSNSGYGIGEPGKFCTEETPLRPVSLYGTTKVEAEEILLEKGGGVSLRLATVFGMSPRMRLDLLVNDFVYRAVNDQSLVLFESHFKRNYIHVRDVARAFLHVIDNHDDMQGEIYNVGLSDANLSKWELCQKIAEHIPSFQFMEAPIGEDPDKRDYIVSNEKIEATSYKPAHSLDMGIKELIKGYQMIRNSVYSNV
ncbi:MAG: NAD-dependent epimerase/dehydratase [Pseudomonadota bacterium]|nr:NAD-dependent epimerase/dehydratase [Pseudomonadota bacterium]